MLKISQIEPAHRTVTLRLEGRVVGPWVAELRKSCDEVLGAGRLLKVHLAEVEFMDAAGVALLECPPFAAEQLKTSGKS